MNKYIVITASGPDKTGIVDQITKILLDNNANVEESRMARLGGEFAVILLVSIPADKSDRFIKELDKLKNIPLTISVKFTKPSKNKQFEGYVPYEITVHGTDQEGIIHSIAHYLSEKRINIESLDTTVINAPITGTPLFSMRAIIQSPAKISLHDLRNNLTDIGNKMGTDIDIRMLGY